MLCDSKQTQEARDKKEAEISRRLLSMEYHLKGGRKRLQAPGHFLEFQSKSDAVA